MLKLSGNRVTIGSRRMFGLALLVCLSATPSISAPLNVLAGASPLSKDHKICEAEYTECLKRIESGYTRHKISCEKSFRQCERRKNS
jgi:hypothetical protein